MACPMRRSIFAPSRAYVLWRSWSVTPSGASRTTFPVSRVRPSAGRPPPKKFQSKRALLKAMQLVHKRSLVYMKKLSDDALDRQLRFSWLPRMSVRQALLYVFAHEVHHRAQVYT